MRDVQYNPGDGTIHRAPNARFGDITRTTVTHGRYRITVRTRLRDLKRDGHASVRTALQVPGGQEFDTEHDLVGNTVHLTLLGSSDGDIPCHGLKSRVSFARNWSWVSVPRSCVAHPKWVRVKVMFYWEQFGTEHYEWDNAFEDFGVPNVGRSPRIHRAPAPGG